MQAFNSKLSNQVYTYDGIEENTKKFSLEPCNDTGKLSINLSDSKEKEWTYWCWLEEQHIENLINVLKYYKSNLITIKNNKK